MSISGTMLWVLLYQQAANLPCENHKRLPVICAGRKLRSIGLQHSQTKLEDGFDSVEEEAVDHADGAVERQDAQEQGEEPRQGHRGEGGKVWNLFSQLWQTLPDELLEHRLVNLSACRRGRWSQTVLGQRTALDVSLSKFFSKLNIFKTCYDSHKSDLFDAHFSLIYGFFIILTTRWQHKHAIQSVLFCSSTKDFYSKALLLFAK